jgi:hypothetical protein
MAMRLVCFGDIHMALRAVERLGSELAEADVAILTGDITNFGDPPDAARVVDAVRRHCPTVLAVTGNLDMPWVIDAFRAEGISLHGEGRRFGDLGVFGCGGSNVTPMDTPTEFEEHELEATPLAVERDALGAERVDHPRHVEVARNCQDGRTMAADGVDHARRVGRVAEVGDVAGQDGDVGLGQLASEPLDRAERHVDVSEADQAHRHHALSAPVGSRNA